MSISSRNSAPAPRAAISSAARQQLELAQTLQQNGRPIEALSRYDAALAAAPDYPAALHLSALLLSEIGRSGEAVTRIERLLSLDDTDADSLSNAGLIYHAAGRHGDAIDALERAVVLDAASSGAWVNLASVRILLDQPIAGEAAARRALAIKSSTGGWYNLALSLSAQGRSTDALAALDQFCTRHGVDAREVGVAGLRAQLLIARGQRDDAYAVLDAAIAYSDQPRLRLERARLADARRDERTAINDYGVVLRSQYDETIHETALSEVVFMLKHWAAWEGLPELLEEFRLRVESHVPRGDASSLTPFSFLSDRSTRAEQRHAAEAWSRRFRTVAPSSRPLSTGRLRIGYLSADLHDHATGILAAGLFERHDRDRFEVFAYSTGHDDGSAMRKRLVAAFDRFVDARGWDVARIAEAIDADAIDILVDLKGHSEHASTGVMALRPAPIAVSYLGYPGTMGAPFIDYLIGDRLVTPLAEASDYSETLVHLPDSYQITDDRRAIADAPTRADLGLPDDAVVLCCFNATYKINEDVVRAWASILNFVPHAVLWLQVRGDHKPTRARLRMNLSALGVTPDRVVFADQRPHAEYLAQYRCADLFLDTWPYNAHTTASDALWAGCPVLTRRGDTFAGRVAESVLVAAGLEDLVMPDRASYIQTAVALSNDRARLAVLKERVASTVRSSPLFDTEATTRAIEAAFVEMAAQHRAGRRDPIVLPG